MNFIQGTLDILILRSFSDGSRHGYDVVDWIHRVTQGEVRVVDAALYTSLHRMEKRGWLRAEWRVSERGRRAKYYQLTPTGRKQLVAGERKWSKFSTAVTRLFAGG